MCVVQYGVWYGGSMTMASVCVWRAADYMISAVCSQTGVRGALPGGVPWQTVGYTTNNWNSVVEKCDGAVRAV